MTSMLVSLNFEVLLSITPDIDYHLLFSNPPINSSVFYNTTNCHIRSSSRQSSASDQDTEQQIEDQKKEQPQSSQPVMSDTVR